MLSWRRIATKLNASNINYYLFNAHTCIVYNTLLRWMWANTCPGTGTRTFDHEQKHCAKQRAHSHCFPLWVWNNVNFESISKHRWLKHSENGGIQSEHVGWTHVKNKCQKNESKSFSCGKFVYNTPNGHRHCFQSEAFSSGFLPRIFRIFSEKCL